MNEQTDKRSNKYHGDDTCMRWASSSKIKAVAHHIQGPDIIIQLCIPAGALLPTAGAFCLLLVPFAYCWCLLQVPFAYCWSEALVPKPVDWGPHIDVVGYCFLNEGSHMKYRPPQELKEFLAAGKPPVYIGFGSLIVDDAKKLTRIILEAAKETNQRVLLSRYGTNKQQSADVMLLGYIVNNYTALWVGCARTA